jgi:hypothetical protein
MQFETSFSTMKYAVALVLAVNFCFTSAFWPFNRIATPDGPDVVKNKVEVTFSPDNVKVIAFPMGKFPKLYKDKDFNITRPTVIYFHGFLVDSTDKSVTALRAAYVGYNFVAIDWSYYSIEIGYFMRVVPQLKIVRAFALNWKHP